MKNKTTIKVKMVVFAENTVNVKMKFYTKTSDSLRTKDGYSIL